MTARVSPRERIRAELDDLFASEGDLGEALEKDTWLAPRPGLQGASEAEVTELSGLRLPRAASGNQPGEVGFAQWLQPGHDQDHGRSGRRGTPEAASHDRALVSRLLGKGVCRTNAIDSSDHRRLRTRHVDP